MNNNNLAAQTNFMAGSDKLGLTSLYLTSLSIPGIQMSHPEVHAKGGSPLFVTADNLTFNPLSIEVLIDENFAVYNELMTKIFQNVSPLTGTFATQEFDFWIDVNNVKGFRVFKLEFNNCRIESIGDISLDTTSSETENTLSIEIKYDTYNIVFPNSNTLTLQV